MDNDKLQQQRQSSGFLGETQGGESMGGLTMAPPQFKLAASAADGGGNGSEETEEGLQHNGFKGTPLEADVAEWPGEVVIIHSPCYSQEIESIALSASGKPEMYLSASAEIECLIEECKGRKFQNAAGEVNTWADDKLKGTVKMNPGNYAATANGKTGWPKLVILTFWKDPSNPNAGGFNFTHLIYFPFKEVLPPEFDDMMPGGSILMGDGGGGGIDLGHHAKSADINEWLPIISKAMNQLAGMKNDPKSFGKSAQKWVEEMKKMAEDLERITSKVRDMEKAYDENESEKEMGKKWEGEKYVEIDGKQYERTNVYEFKYWINGEEHTAQRTPQAFIKEHGDSPDFKVVISEIPASR